jgi:hypothetical protein
MILIRSASMPTRVVVVRDYLVNYKTTLFPEKRPVKVCDGYHIKYKDQVDLGPYFRDEEG